MPPTPLRDPYDDFSSAVDQYSRSMHLADREAKRAEAARQSEANALKRDSARAAAESMSARNKRFKAAAKEGGYSKYVYTDEEGASRSGLTEEQHADLAQKRSLEASQKAERESASISADYLSEKKQKLKTDLLTKYERERAEKELLSLDQQLAVNEEMSNEDGYAESRDALTKSIEDTRARILTDDDKRAKYDEADKQYNTARSVAKGGIPEGLVIPNAVPEDNEERVKMIQAYNARSRAYEEKNKALTKSRLANSNAYRDEEVRILGAYEEWVKGGGTPEQVEAAKKSRDKAISGAYKTYLERNYTNNADADQLMNVEYKSIQLLKPFIEDVAGAYKEDRIKEVDAARKAYRQDLYDNADTFKKTSPETRLKMRQLADDIYNKNITTEEANTTYEKIHQEANAKSIAHAKTVDAFAAKVNEIGGAAYADVLADTPYIGWRPELKVNDKGGFMTKAFRASGDLVISDKKRKSQGGIIQGTLNNPLFGGVKAGVNVVGATLSTLRKTGAAVTRAFDNYEDAPWVDDFAKANNLNQEQMLRVYEDYVKSADDWEDASEETRVLNNGTVLFNPNLIAKQLDADEYKRMVKESGTAPYIQQRMMSPSAIEQHRDNTVTQHGAMLERTSTSAEKSMNEWFNRQIALTEGSENQFSDLSYADQVQAFLKVANTATDGGVSFAGSGVGDFFDRAGQTINLGALKAGQHVYGSATLISDSNPLRDILEDLARESTLVRETRDITTSKGGVGTKITDVFFEEAQSMVMTLGAGGVGSKVASFVVKQGLKQTAIKGGRSLADKAVQQAIGRTLTKDAVRQVIGKAGFGTASAAGGLQSYGLTYAQNYVAAIDKAEKELGRSLTDDEKKEIANSSDVKGKAIFAGAITSTVMLGFGRTGADIIFKPSSSLRNSTMRDFFRLVGSKTMTKSQKMVVLRKGIHDVLKPILFEAADEGTDELLASLAVEGRSFGQSMDAFWEAAIAGGIMGGVAGSPRSFISTGVNAQNLTNVETATDALRAVYGKEGAFEPAQVKAGLELINSDPAKGSKDSEIVARNLKTAIETQEKITQSEAKAKRQIEEGQQKGDNEMVDSGMRAAQEARRARAIIKVASGTKVSDLNVDDRKAFEANLLDDSASYEMVGDEVVITDSSIAQLATTYPDAAGDLITLNETQQRQRLAAKEKSAQTAENKVEGKEIPEGAETTPSPKESAPPSGGKPTETQAPATKKFRVTLTATDGSPRTVEVEAGSIKEAEDKAILDHAKDGEVLEANMTEEVGVVAPQSPAAGTQPKESAKPKDTPTKPAPKPAPTSKKELLSALFTDVTEDAEMKESFRINPDGSLTLKAGLSKAKTTEAVVRALISRVTKETMTDSGAANLWEAMPASLQAMITKRFTYEKGNVEMSPVEGTRFLLENMLNEKVFRATLKSHIRKGDKPFVKQMLKFIRSFLNEVRKLLKTAPDSVREQLYQYENYAMALLKESVSPKSLEALGIATPATKIATTADATLPANISPMRRGGYRVMMPDGTYRETRTRNQAISLNASKFEKQAIKDIKRSHAEALVSGAITRDELLASINTIVAMVKSVAKNSGYSAESIFASVDHVQLSRRSEALSELMDGFRQILDARGGDAAVTAEMALVNEMNKSVEGKKTAKPLLTEDSAPAAVRQMKLAADEGGLFTYLFSNSKNRIYLAQILEATDKMMEKLANESELEKAADAKNLIKKKLALGVEFRALALEDYLAKLDPELKKNLTKEEQGAWAETQMQKDSDRIIKEREKLDAQILARYDEALSEMQARRGNEYRMYGGQLNTEGETGLGIGRQTVQFGRGANPTTAPHEFIHVLTERKNPLSGNSFLYDALGREGIKKLNSWMRDAINQGGNPVELVAEAIEKYIRNGKAPAQIEDSIATLADGAQKYYESVEGETVGSKMYDQRVKDVLDEIFTADNTQSNQVTKYRAKAASKRKTKEKESKGVSTQSPNSFRKSSDGRMQISDEVKMIRTDDGRTLSAAGLINMQSAFHGTRHKIEGEMSTDKIGSGEGQQVYGWGLYFTETKSIAEMYQNMDAGLSWVELDGTKLYLNQEFNYYQQQTLNTVESRGLDGAREYYINKMIEAPDLIKAGRVSEDYYNDAVDSIVFLTRFDKDLEERLEMVHSEEGNLYTVELDVEQNELLDWDKPLSEQSEKVQDAIKTNARKRERFQELLQTKPFKGRAKKIKDLEAEIKKGLDFDISKITRKMGGSDLYDMLVQSNARDPKQASEALAKAGIKGIKYLDGDSRDKGEGTYNYVMFNEADVSITHENGVARPFEAQPESAINAQSPTAAQDSEYLQLAKDPEKNKSRMREILDTAAKSKGALILDGSMEFVRGGFEKGLTKYKGSSFWTINSAVDVAEMYSKDASLGISAITDGRRAALNEIYKKAILRPSTPDVLLHLIAHKMVFENYNKQIATPYDMELREYLTEYADELSTEAKIKQLLSHKPEINEKDYKAKIKLLKEGKYREIISQQDTEKGKLFYREFSLYGMSPNDLMDAYGRAGRGEFYGMMTIFDEELAIGDLRSITHAYLFIKNPAFSSETGHVTPDTMQSAENSGHDGMVNLDAVGGALVDSNKSDRTERSPEIVAFKPSQVKLHDLITRDVFGRIIPPSQRFDSSTDEVNLQSPNPKNLKPEAKPVRSVSDTEYRIYKKFGEAFKSIGVANNTVPFGVLAEWTLGKQGSQINLNSKKLSYYSDKALDLIVREELIHASSYKVIKNSGVDYIAYHEDLYEEMKRDGFAEKFSKVYKSNQTPMNQAAEFKRAAIQKILYGTVTEQEMRTKSFQKIADLLKGIIDFFEKKIKTFNKIGKNEQVFNDTVAMMREAETKVRFQSSSPKRKNQSGLLESFRSNSSTLTKMIKENPWGFTIDQNSDFAPKGYAVAASKDTETVVGEDFTDADLEQFFVDHKEVFETEGAHLGGWKRGDGKFVLDVSFPVADFETAVRVGILSNQDAIFHIDGNENEQEISLKQDGKQKTPEGFAESAEEILSKREEIGDVIALASGATRRVPSRVREEGNEDVTEDGGRLRQPRTNQHKQILEAIIAEDYVPVETSPLEGGKVRTIAKILLKKSNKIDWSRNWRGLKKNFAAGQEKRFLGDVEKASDNMLEVAEQASVVFPEFQSWYETRLKMAMDIFEELDPDASKPENNFILRVLLAVTSNGNKVKDQTFDTWKVYNDWKSTGKMGDTKVSGKRANEISNALARVDKLTQILGWKKVDSFLQTEGTVKDLRDAIVNDFGFTAEEAKDITKGELIDEVVPFALIFGAKLGSFFFNLSGNFNTTTMDRWFMRTFGRALGSQMQRVDKKVLLRSRKRYKDALDAAKSDKGAMSVLQSSGVRTNASTSHATLKKITDHFTIPKNRKDLSPVLDELRLSSNGYIKIADGLSMVEAPKSGGHRRFIRLTMDRVRAKLQERSGKDWNPAELQALLWYYEKLIHDTYGSKQKDDPDYGTAANELYKSIRRGEDSRSYRPSVTIRGGKLAGKSLAVVYGENGGRVNQQAKANNDFYVKPDITKQPIYTDKQIREYVSKMHKLYGGSVKSMLDGIIKEGSSEFADLAKAMLKSHNKKFLHAPIRWDKRTDRSYEQGGKITLRWDAPVKTWLHEYAHVSTVGTLLNDLGGTIHDQLIDADYRDTAAMVGSGRAGGSQARYTTAQREMFRLFDIAQKTVPQLTRAGAEAMVTVRQNENLPADQQVHSNVAYGMGNVLEFVAQAMSNVEMQKFLNNISDPKRKGQRSLLDSLFDAIRKILGVPVKMNSVLASVLTLTEDIATDGMVTRDDGARMSQQVNLQSNNPDSSRDEFFRKFQERIKKRAEELKAASPDFKAGDKMYAPSGRELTYISYKGEVSYGEEGKTNTYKQVAASSVDENGNKEISSYMLDQLLVERPSKQDALVNIVNERVVSRPARYRKGNKVFSARNSMNPDERLEMENRAFNFAVKYSPHYKFTPQEVNDALAAKRLIDGFGNEEASVNLQSPRPIDSKSGRAAASRVKTSDQERDRMMQDRDKFDDNDQKVVQGDPKKAKWSSDPATRNAEDVIKEMYLESYVAEDRAKWEAEAAIILAKPANEIEQMIYDYANGDYVGEVTGGTIIAASRYTADKLQAAIASGSKDAINEALILGFAHQEGRANPARLMAAMKDPFQTPQQRAAYAIGIAIHSPSVEVISALKKKFGAKAEGKNGVGAVPKQNREAYYKALAEYQTKRYERAKKQLKKDGINIADVFNASHQGNGVGTAADAAALAGFSNKHKQVINKWREGSSPKTIQASTGVDPKSHNKIIAKFRAEVEKQARKIAIDGYRVDTMDDYKAGRPPSTMPNKPTEIELNEAVEAIVEHSFRAGRDRVKDFNILDPRDVMAAFRSLEKMDEDFVTRTIGTWYANVFSAKTVAVNLLSIPFGGYRMLVDRGAEAAFNAYLKNPDSASLAEYKYLKEGWKEWWAKGAQQALIAFDTERAYFNKFKEGGVAANPYKGESSEEVRGYQMGHLLDYVDDLISKLMKGRSPQRPATLTRLAGGNKTKDFKLGKLARGVLRFNLGVDEFLRYNIAGAEVTARAYREGVKRGLSGKELGKFIKLETKTLGSKSWDAAGKQADISVFTENLPKFEELDTSILKDGDILSLLGDTMSAVVGAADSYIKDSDKKLKAKVDIADDALATATVQGLRLALGGVRITIMPFTRVIMNLIRKGFHYVPNPLVTAITGYKVVKYAKNNRGEADPEAAHAIHRFSSQIVSSIIASVIYGMAEGDDDDGEKDILITGSMDKFGEGSRAARNAAYAEGMGQYRVRVFGKTFDYGRIDPAAITLGTTVDMIRNIKKTARGDQGLWDWTQDFVANTMISQMTDKTMLRGINELLMMKDEKKRPEQWLARQLATMLVPNVIRQPIRDTNKYYDETGLDDEGMEGFARILAYELYPNADEGSWLPKSKYSPAPSRNAFGEKMKRPDGLGKKIPAAGHMIDWILKTQDYKKVRDIEAIRRYNKRHPMDKSVNIPNKSQKNYRYTVSDNLRVTLPMTNKQWDIYSSLYNRYYRSEGATLMTDEGAKSIRAKRAAARKKALDIAIGLPAFKKDTLKVYKKLKDKHNK